VEKTAASPYSRKKWVPFLADDETDGADVIDLSMDDSDALPDTDDSMHTNAEDEEGVEEGSQADDVGGAAEAVVGTVVEAVGEAVDEMVQAPLLGVDIMVRSAFFSFFWFWSSTYPLV